MKQLSFILSYLKYYFAAKTKHRVHSPFVFKLVTEVITADTPKDIYQDIENRRSELIGSDAVIEFEDFGAKPGIYTKSVSGIAKRALKPKKYAQLLYRLVNHHLPETSIELGTSLGVSTLYQAKGMKNGTLYTLEGSRAVLNIAQEGFETINTGAKIKAIPGNFNETLPHLLNELSRVDYVYFDGNHRKAPTLHYFNLCLPKATNESVFIFDDINWSDEMKEAWEEVKQHPRVTVTIDLFFIGIVYFRKEQVKEHFKIRF